MVLRCLSLYFDNPFVINKQVHKYLNTQNRHGFTRTEGSGLCPNDEGRRTGKSAQQKSRREVTSTCRAHACSFIGIATHVKTPYFCVALHLSK